MRILPLHGRPMLHLSGAEEVLVVADLHIGLEAHLSWKGFHMPSQTNRMRSDIIKAAEGMDALIVLGDVKHRVPGSTRQEHREIPPFFEALLDAFGRVEVVRGNHDVSLEEFLPDEVVIHPASGLLMDGIGLMHGHTIPSPRLSSCRTWICAHNHSRISFPGPQGSGPTEPCWMRIPFRKPEERPEELVVMPAFNPNLGGSPVNIEGEGLLGPVLNSPLLDVDRCRIHLLDGADMGLLRDLMVPGRIYRKRKLL